MHEGILLRTVCMCVLSMHILEEQPTHSYKLFSVFRLLQRETYKTSPQSTEETDAENVEPLTDDEKRQKVRVQMFLHYIFLPNMNLAKWGN